MDITCHAVLIEILTPTFPKSTMWRNWVLDLFLITIILEVKSSNIQFINIFLWIDICNKYPDSFRAVTLIINEKVLKISLFKKGKEKSPGSATITSRSLSQTPTGRGNRENQTSANRTNIRKALRLDLSSPSEVIAMLKGQSLKQIAL